MADIFNVSGSVELDSKGALKGLDELDGRVEATARKLETEGAGVENSLGRLANSIGGMATKVGTVMTGVAVAIGGVATKSLVDFEETVAKVGTLVSDEFAPNISSDMKSLSVTLGKDAEDIGEAMYQGLSAGVSENNIKDFTYKMGKLAKGGFAEVSQATDIATTIINSYGMAVEDAGIVSDKLITIQNKGKCFAPSCRNAA